jgi:hypothetical protein
MKDYFLSFEIGPDVRDGNVCKCSMVTECKVFCLTNFDRDGKRETIIYLIVGLSLSVFS